jgi:EF hand
MMTQKIAAIAAVLGLTVGLSAVPAQAANKTSSTHMAVWDTDHDGTLDLAEAKTAAQAKFDALDADHDGTLDKKEFPGRKGFAKADPDKDGTIDKDEYLALVEKRFNAADTDHDGTLSKAELKSPAGRALARLLK